MPSLPKSERFIEFDLKVGYPLKCIMTMREYILIMLLDISQVGILYVKYEYSDLSDCLI